MTEKTMTLVLNGEVPLDLFARAMTRFQGLVHALTNDISPKAKIEWVVSDLNSGSAQATVRGVSSEPDAVDPIPVAYLAVGSALAEARPIPYSPRVAREARGIAKILNGKVTSIRFETQDDDATVINSSGEEPRPRPIGAYGAIEGRVQTLSSRNTLRFTLYDAFHDRAVSCYLQEGREDIMRDAWDRRAMVEGWISRDGITGRPTTIRRVQRVDVFGDVVPGAALRAVRGIAPLPLGAPSAVDVIRKRRDA